MIAAELGKLFLEIPVWVQILVPPWTSCEALLSAAGPFGTSLPRMQSGVIISPPLWGNVSTDGRSFIHPVNTYRVPNTCRTLSQELEIYLRTKQ